MSVCGLCGDRHNGSGWCKSCHDTVDESKPFEVDTTPPGPSCGIVLSDELPAGGYYLSTGNSYSHTEENIRRRGAYTRKTRSFPNEQRC